MSRLLAGALLALALSAGAALAGTPVISLTRGEFALADTPALPAGDDARWQAIELPHTWGEQSLREQGGWYRFRFEPPAIEGPIGLYLPRLHLNAAVFLNGAFLGDGGRMTEPIARNWNYPLYFTLPGALIRPGVNELHIRLRTEPGFGMLLAPRVGAESALKPIADRQTIWQVDSSKALAGVLFGTSLFLAGLWWRRRGDRLYLWAAGACLAWAAFSLYLIVRNPIIPGLTAWWLAHSALDLWMALLIGFSHRYLAIRRPRIEWLALANAAASFVVVGLTPITFGGYASRVFHLVTMAGGIYLFVFAWRAWRRTRAREALVLTSAFGFLAIAGLHDWLITLPFRWVPREVLVAMAERNHFHVAHFAAPLMLLFIAWHLSRRFVNALDELERLNRDLEARLAAGRAALEESFEARRTLERRQAAMQERERIYGDLHDDVGAKLLSLAIGAERREHADLARSALQDLRDVVSRSTDEVAPLSYALADWRAEIERRLAAAGLALAWHAAPDLPDPPLAAPVALALGRILREATSNVLKHAQAHRVRVDIALSGDELTIALSDDGRGWPNSLGPPATGRGVRSMRARAERLGGRIEWRAAPSGGASVTLGVPLATLAQAGAPAQSAQNTVVTAR